MESNTGRTIFAAMAVLIAIGIVSIASANAGTHPTDSSEFTGLLKKQAILVAIAFAGFLVFVDVDHRVLRTVAPAFYVLTILLLVLVLIPGFGVKVNGQRRWFRVAGFGCQPSEVAKLAVVLAIARLVHARGSAMGDVRKGLVPGLAIIALPCVLIMMETDFGTSVFIAGIGTTLLLVSGVRLSQLLPLVAVGLPVVFIAGFHRFAHVRQRIEIFMHPETDPLGKGHQILQSLIALGNGGTSGLGLGMGRQKRFFLPENSTDFIFSTLAEEVGFVGCVLVVAVFAFLFFQGARVAFRAPDAFTSIAALGISLVIGCQAIANIAVVTSVVPTKGIALPFVSYGGSQLVTMTAMVGVLVSLARASAIAEAQRARAARQAVREAEAASRREERVTRGTQILRRADLERRAER